MSNPREPLMTDGLYHVFNRGVAKQEIFHTEYDYRHMLETLSYFQESTRKGKLSVLSDEQLAEILSQPVQAPLVEILAYCLMPNHFHLLLRQCTDGGISLYMQRVQNSYSRYYNTKRKRVGPLLQGPFKSVTVGSDQQLLHLSRYIHLNPVVARLSKTPIYPWSSYSQYAQATSTRLCNPEMILTMSNSAEGYTEFVTDYADYAISLHDYKDLLIDV